MKSNKFLLLIAFTSGMTVMAMEISFARLIAPFFGNTLIVWTNIIGIVLIALSLGYYFGGKYADRHPHLKKLLAPLLLAGLIFLTVPWLVKPLSLYITGESLTLSSTSIIFTGSFLVSLLLVSFPLLLLGMTSPFIIRIYQVKTEHLGEMAGKVFAVSTIGSILGTFLPTLWLIPVVGTRITITIFASILIAITLLGLIKGKLRYLAIIILLFPLLTKNSQALNLRDNAIHEDESIYQHIEVLEDRFSNRFLIFNEGLGIQSIYRPKAILTGLYYDYFLPLVDLLDDGDTKEIAIIGLAGGSLSTELNHFFSNEIHIDGVEIDKKVIAIAEEFFDIKNENLTIHNQDGHIFLKFTEKLYDLIVIDAYSQQFYIPWTMTTQEFWHTVQNALHSNGIVSMNVNATSEDSPLLQAISNTVASVFPHTYRSKVTIGGGFNYMITGSNHELDLENLPNLIQNQLLLPMAESIATNTVRIQHNPQAMILTDDRAPIELMTDQMFFSIKD